MVCLVCGKEFDDNKMIKINVGGPTPRWECLECNRRGNMRCDGRRSEIVTKLKKRKNEHG